MFHQVLSLFLTFMKIGGFTFGGGYAMIPLMEREAAEKRHWIQSSDLLDIVAVAESTPGPIAINAATLIGYRVAGVLGAVAATLGVVFPSFVILFGLSFVLSQFGSLRAVRYAFFGVRAGVLTLMLKALFSMYKKVPKNALGYCLIALSFIAVTVFHFEVIGVLLFCAVAGLCVTLIRRQKENPHDPS